MIDPQTSAADFLKAAYETLEFTTGNGYYRLTDTTSLPNLAQVSWLEQARKLGAETIFFVGDFPTVLFFKIDRPLDTNTDRIEDEIRQLHLQVWNKRLLEESQNLHY